MNVKNTRSNQFHLNQLVSNVPARRNLVDRASRNKLEWNQWQSITKAINHVETATKEKHMRKLIFCTFRLEGSRLFWLMITRLHVDSNPITSWKFFYVIHRLLRDGHKHVVTDAILLSSYFDYLSNHWRSSQQNYGILAYRYCQLIIRKLKFHQQNPIFTGNLTVGEHNNVRCLFNNDLNLYFQLCIDLLDYMDELLNLVQTIFSTFQQSHKNSNTKSIE